MSGVTPATYLRMTAHDGFHGFTDKEPGIKNRLDHKRADWKQDQAYNIMATSGAAQQ